MGTKEGNFLKQDLDFKTDLDDFLCQAQSDEPFVVDESQPIVNSTTAEIPLL
jgi:hypothetical protein